jgi:hypothetical protein
MERHIKVLGGKYEFVDVMGECRIDILRNGQPWLRIEKGARAIAALLLEHEELMTREAEHGRHG